MTQYEDCYTIHKKILWAVANIAQHVAAAVFRVGFHTVGVSYCDDCHHYSHSHNYCTDGLDGTESNVDVQDAAAAVRSVFGTAGNAEVDDLLLLYRA
jgi:hypothetical protein